MLTVDFCLQLLNEHFRVFCPYVCVKGHSSRFAEGFQGKTRAKTVLRISSGIETINRNRKAFFLEWLKVFCIESRASFSRRIEAGSGFSLEFFGMANNEHGIIREVVSWHLCGGGTQEKTPKT
jgi:hypothetical protein